MATRRMKKTRACKHGKLKQPVKIKNGGKRICKRKPKRSSRKPKRSSRKPKRSSRKPKRSSRKHTYKFTAPPEENVKPAKQNIMDLAMYIKNNLKTDDQDPNKMIPDTIIQIYKVLVPGVISKQEENEIIAIGERVRENNKNNLRTEEKYMRRMVRILVNTRQILHNYQ